MLEIIGRPSSINVRKVLWLSEELGIDYCNTHQSITAAELVAPAFTALNPNAQMPLIREDDWTLWESHAICRYLVNREQAWHLYPLAPRERARVDQWLDWQATDLNTAWRYCFMARVRQSPAFADPEQAATSERKWHDCMHIVNQQLDHAGPFICGDRFTLADISIGLSIHRWYLTPMTERPDLPAVSRYYDLLNERSGYRQFGRNGEP
ncbi:glutathione S-transferase N-terminal domain-containing protein [Burkholderiaceae bacterium DAT-1]|nr:glutathione S-transferase N-terminal domain-containing protein [Burkholderiaceae bacterium DAT-1]